MTTKNTVNYTDEMVAILKDAAPIDYDKAQLLAAQLDRGVRSIIAKCKREGIDYISKPAPAKKKSMPSKADTVAGICELLEIESCAGLEKATGAALNQLVTALVRGAS
jgi:methionine synthase II (cobalamin-independent)